MVNKGTDGGFVAQYAIIEVKMEVTLVNSSEFVTVDFHVSFISITKKLESIDF
jgi:hypothetical protein